MLDRERRVPNKTGQVKRHRDTTSCCTRRGLRMEARSFCCCAPRHRKTLSPYLRHRYFITQSRCNQQQRACSGNLYATTYAGPTNPPTPSHDGLFQFSMYRQPPQRPPKLFLFSTFFLISALHANHSPNVVAEAPLTDDLFRVLGRRL